MTTPSFVASRPAGRTANASAIGASAVPSKETARAKKTWRNVCCRKIPNWPFIRALLQEQTSAANCREETSGARPGRRFRSWLCARGLSPGSNDGSRQPAGHALGDADDRIYFVGFVFAATGRWPARAKPGAPASIARYVKRRQAVKVRRAGGALLDQDVRRAGRQAPVFLAACAASVAGHSSGSGPAGSHVPHGTAAQTGLGAALKCGTAARLPPPRVIMTPLLPPYGQRFSGWLPNPAGGPFVVEVEGSGRWG